LSGFGDDSVPKQFREAVYTYYVKRGVVILSAALLALSASAFSIALVVAYAVDSARAQVLQDVPYYLLILAITMNEAVIWGMAIQIVQENARGCSGDNTSAGDRGG
jgi:hypothetical protein